MTHRRTIPIVAVAAVVGMLLWSQSQARSPKRSKIPAAARIAVCDMEQVVGNSARAKHRTKTFKKRRKRIQQAEQARGKEIKNLQMELEEAKPGTKAYKAQLEVIRKKLFELRVWQQMQQEYMERSYYVDTRRMYNDAAAIIAKFAAEEGIDVVMHRRTAPLTGKNVDDLVDNVDARKVVYAAKELDITDKIMARVDAAFHKSQK